MRSKLKLHRETKQKSKRKSEESQLLLKSKGCNEIQGFRGNCDSLGKLGMCPSLAESDSGGFSRSNFEMFHMKYFVATVPPEQLQDTCFLFRFHKAGRACSPRLEKLSLFSPPPPCAMLLAHGGGGEKSDSFSRRGEQDRPALCNLNSKQASYNCSGGTVVTENFIEKLCS